ncbi:ORF207 [Saltwater crocodilepox virus]|nr:ORF207 [Saltwater crocodilepox virus]QGT47934.1 ORF207 [Saltwater crocodilepox virus]QGT48144.1 ORF207 [Saltwater crocodilepox virus]
MRAGKNQEAAVSRIMATVKVEVMRTSLKTETTIAPRLTNYMDREHFDVKLRDLG